MKAMIVGLSVLVAAFGSAFALIMLLKLLLGVTEGPVVLFGMIGVICMGFLAHELGSTILKSYKND